jgi:hypothetical protein
MYKWIKCNFNLQFQLNHNIYYLKTIFDEILLRKVKLLSDNSERFTPKSLEIND